MATNPPFSKSRRSRLAVAALGVELSAGTPPADVRLIPAGEFRAFDGRPKECDAWVLSAADGERIATAVAKRASALVIDYEHATLHAKRTGAQAPAAGWFRAVEWRDGSDGSEPGLWALGVDWTVAAASKIADREYRYLSPVFTYDPKTGRVKEILHAALTNDPALDGLTDLAALAAGFFNDFQPQEETPRMYDDILERLRYLLNLPTLATPADIVAELDKLKALLQTAAPNMEAATGFDLAGYVAGLSGEVAALSSRINDPAQFVPATAVAALQRDLADATSRLAALTAERHAELVERDVAAAIDAGKVAPAQAEWARAYCSADRAGFATFVASAPVQVAIGELATLSRVGAGADKDVSFAAPDGFAVDAEGLALHRAALSYAEQHKTDYLAAVRAVSARP